MFKNMVLIRAPGSASRITKVSNLAKPMCKAHPAKLFKEHMSSRFKLVAIQCHTMLCHFWPTDSGRSIQAETNGFIYCHSIAEMSSEMIIFSQTRWMCQIIMKLALILETDTSGFYCKWGGLNLQVQECLVEIDWIWWNEFPEQRLIAVCYTYYWCLVDNFNYKIANLECRKKMVLTRLKIKFIDQLPKSNGCCSIAQSSKC